MKNLKKTRVFSALAVLFTSAITMALVFANVNIKSFSFVAKADSDYKLVLDSSNAVSSAGDHIQRTIRGSEITLTYANVTSSVGNHTKLNEGGTIVNKTLIHSIDSVKASFSGVLKARISYDGSSWNDYFGLTSDIEVPVGSHPYYIEFKAFSGAVTVSSVEVTFTCQVNQDALPQQSVGSYDVLFKKNSSDDNTDIGTNQTSLKAEIDEGSSYISTMGSGSKVYAGSEGLKFGSSKGPGSLTIGFNSSNVKEEIKTINIGSSQYGTDGGKFHIYINDSETYTEITPSNGGSVTVDGALTSLTIQTTTKRAYLEGFSLNYDTTVDPDAPYNPDVYVSGFTASDGNKDTYTTNSVFATDNALVASKVMSNSTLVGLNSSEFSYEIRNSSNVLIDPTQKFPAIGTYKLIVSYKNYVPVEITLNVGEYVYVTDVAASMTTTSFNTAHTLANELEGNLTANLEFSNNTSGSNIAYSEFGQYGIATVLLNPKGITHDMETVFGTAGTWTLKVFAVDDANMYYNISLTVAAIPVVSITLNKTTHSMEVEDTVQLTASVGPENATNQLYVWSSNNTEVASVSESGLVTALAVGKATISATAVDGSGVYGSCVVTVNAKPVEPTYTLITSSSSLSNNDKVVITTSRTGGTIEGVTGWNGTKDATVSTNSSNWLQFVVGNKSGDAWTLYDESASKYIQSPSANEFKYGTTGGTCSTNSSGVLACNSRYLAKNVTVSSGNTSTFYRFYQNTTNTNTTTYTPMYVYKVSGGSTPAAETIYPTSISLTALASSISIGGTSQLTVGYTPSDTNVKNVTFTSNNENIATVSNTGLITGVAEGSATITATAEAANSTTKTATFNITVTPIAVTGVSLTSNSETIKVGKTVTLSAYVSPSNATNKNVTWSSSNTSIATVSNGVVTGVAAGTATITVTTVSGSKTATCKVVVQASGGEETFTITYSDLPTSYQTGSTVYTAASGIKFQAYNCANYSSKVQFKASSGYLQSTEDLELQSITINDRESNTLTIYGSNTAGSFSTVITGTNDVYDLTGYSYFKIARTASGAAYCASITVVTGTPTPTDPTSIILSPTSAELAPSGTKQLSVSYVPSNANQNKEVTWTSSNTNVATVSSEGLVSVKSTATAGQTATITAKLTNIASIQATCSITIVEQSKDDHTVLIYMCGADLESENKLASGDIQEILKVTDQPDDVNIVIETGGAKSWASTYGISSTYLERYHVENKSLVRDNQLTYASMGLSSTLQSFIEYGLNNFPAERTGLVFWNHGGGMRGVCYDEKKNDDVLKNSEIKSAVSGALSNCGMSGKKLEWVGYDACLMAVQDIAETNSAYFNYMIASEESEAGYGWDYDNWVDDLYAKKSTTTILKAIVDSFISDNGGANSSSGDQTLSYLNLSYAAAYKTAWENMAAQLNSKVTSSNKSSFNSAITSNVKHYADSDYDYFCTFDAWDFVDKLANNSAFSNFRIDSSYITAVKNAHANLVAYNLAQKGAGVSKGLCMYWPNSSQYSDVSTYYTTSETNFTTWRSFCVNKGIHA